MKIIEVLILCLVLAMFISIFSEYQFTIHTIRQQTLFYNQKINEVLYEN